MSFQRDAAVSSLYFISLQDLSTDFGCSLHPSSGVFKTACATTGTSHSVVGKFRDEVVVSILWLVLVVAHAVLSTPDDGCKEHPKHVERSCSEIKYRLQTAPSRWKLIYIRLVMHGTMNVNLHCNLSSHREHECRQMFLRQKTLANSIKAPGTPISLFTHRLQLKFIIKLDTMPCF
jgi:hypothetical protein